ncbi:MAG TPA: hypothetical protein VF493_12790 [Terriglobales bacterium]
MSRHLLLLLLLASAAALASAQEKPKTQQAAAGAANAQKKTQATQKPTAGVHAGVQRKTSPAQQPTADAQTKKDEPDAEPDDAQAKTDQGAKLTSVPDAKALGMSILGNQDAPKSLVIVPWKSSELGNSPGVSPMLDDSRQPVDKEVFMRSLRYYEIRSKTK